MPQTKKHPLSPCKYGLAYAPLLDWTAVAEILDNTVNPQLSGTPLNVLVLTSTCIMLFPESMVHLHLCHIVWLWNIKFKLSCPEPCCKKTTTTKTGRYKTFITVLHSQEKHVLLVYYIGTQNLRFVAPMPECLLYTFVLKY